MSGGLAAAAFPPVDLGLVAFVALVPLVVVFHTACARRMLAAGAAFGGTFFLALIPWIHLFGLAAYLLLSGLEAAFIAGFLALGTVVRDRLPGGLKGAAFPMAFLAGEYTRSHLPIGGFPWGGLGYSQHNNPVTLRLAAWSGVWGVSLLVLAVNVLVAGVHPAHRREAVLRLAVAVAVAVAPGLLPVARPRGAQATVAMVQGNPPLADRDHPHALDQEAVQAEASLTGTLGGRPVDLVVWPESSLGHDPFHDPSLLAPLVDAIAQAHAPFVVGGTIETEPGNPLSGFRNESIFFNADGSVSGRYVKMHLVPFGEYVPARHLLAGWIKELSRVPADGIPGSSPQVFHLPQGTFGAVICYETAYPELVGSFVRAGARMIVVSTDNSSYHRSAASAQMLAMSQVRAAEQGMWVLQAALTGISAVIAPDGQVRARTSLFEPALLTPTVQFATTTTPDGRYGDWLPLAILGTGLGVLVWAAAGRAEGRRAPGTVAA